MKLFNLEECGFYGKYPTENGECSHVTGAHCEKRLCCNNCMWICNSRCHDSIREGTLRQKFTSGLDR